jgi:mono/diheme cytochrome c family protein
LQEHASGGPLFFASREAAAYIAATIRGEAGMGRSVVADLCGAAWRFAALATLVAGTLLALGARPTLAQVAGGDIWLKAGCADCHGNLAAGDGDPAYPQGPNLRRTNLERADLRETIACGRPGTPMPYHLVDAYTGIACFGMTGAVPDGTRKGGALTAQEIDTLADFLATSVKGVNRITRANCALFNGGNANAPACREFPN